MRYKIVFYFSIVTVITTLIACGNDRMSETSKYATNAATSKTEKDISAMETKPEEAKAGSEETDDIQSEENDETYSGYTEEMITEEFLSNNRDIENEMPETITDSWTEIITSGEEGTYADKYHIGDTKDLDLGSGGVIKMELVALDEDELTNGEGKAHMTWIAKGFLKAHFQMNFKASNEGGWPSTSMRLWLQKSIMPLFPVEVKVNLKEVIKYSYSYSDKGTITSSDTIWIPSMREMFGTDHTDEDRGPIYTEAFPDAGSRAKGAYWMLRSATNYDDYCFWSVDSNGESFPGDTCSENYGIVIGFCL